MTLDVPKALARLAKRLGGEGASLAEAGRLSGGASMETWAFAIEAGGLREDLILRRRGVELHRTAPAVVAPDAAFRERSKAIERRHRAQTLFHVDALRARYREPVFGRVRVWDLVERLAQCVDPTDCRLFCTNQQIHVLQILE